MFEPNLKSSKQIQEIMKSFTFNYDSTGKPIAFNDFFINAELSEDTANRGFTVKYVDTEYLPLYVEPTWVTKSQ